MALGCGVSSLTGGRFAAIIRKISIDELTCIHKSDNNTLITAKEPTDKGERTQPGTQAPSRNDCSIEKNRKKR